MSEFKLIIYKSKRTLELWDGFQKIKDFPIGIGKSELGHKEVEGDMRTPEGEYRVCVKNPKSKFYLSLGLNYPNNQDAKAGLEKSVISKEQYESILSANTSNSIPPWNTPLGGEIFIHGELEKQGWSQGCIRMNNEDIRELYSRLPTGTKVVIYP